MDLSSAARATYQARLVERRAELAHASRVADRLGNVRLVLAFVALALVLLPLFVRHGGPWWSLLPLVIVFMVLGKLLDRAFERRRRLSAAVRFLEEGLMRTDETWRTLESDGAALGARLASGVPYADDLDLFGPASLFQLLDRCSTEGGREILARWLVTAEPPEEILARQRAVTELAPDIAFREGLAASAGGDDHRPVEHGALLAWAESKAPIRFERLLYVLGIAQPVALAITYAIYLATDFALPVLIAAVLQVVTVLATRKLTNARANVLSGPERALRRSANLIAAIEAARFSSPRLVALSARLGTGGASASARILRLERLVTQLDARLNAFFALSVGPALLWDLNLVLRAEAWRRETGPALRGWFSAIGELEAFGSLAALAFERSDYAMPELVQGEATFEAEGLVHPLIERRHAVANDLALGGPGSVLLLSGSNMSGKSTLLRSVGVSVVLAQAGGPVPARGLRMTPLTLASSVRIVDSLAAGTSHFYAELKRLKLITDAATADGPPLLYLLDEMLHGTNSRDRYIGAVSVIRWLCGTGALGIVTTHDLALAAVAQEVPAGKAVNKHFSDDIVDDEIHFDYRLREGPVVSTNALRLMRAVGIDVELIEPAKEEVS